MLSCRRVGFLVVAISFAVGCGSKTKLEVGGSCLLNSDCNSPLVCTMGKCHEGCRVTTDCPAGQSCVKISGAGVCQLPAEAQCSATVPCGPLLICATDLRCRANCTSAAECTTGQVCVQGVCADTSELDVNGQLPQRAPSASDGGSTDAGSDLPRDLGMPDVPVPQDAGGGGGADIALGIDASADSPPGLDVPDAPIAQDVAGTVDGGCLPACTGSTPVCLNGACVACRPGDTGCVSNAPATCSTTGAWVPDAVACVNQVCLNGACQGVCAPGQTGCASSMQPETCTSTGTWQYGTACASGQCISGTCVAAPPSCQTGGVGLSDCGASSESCCTSLPVPGGTYYRTYTYDADGGTGLADPATVSGFRLDKYLVTVGRFRQFVTAWNGGWRPSGGSGIHTHLNGGKGLASAGSPGAYETGWNPMLWNSNVAPTEGNLSSCGKGDSFSLSTWTTAAGGQENLPIDCVNWYEAYAFCIWDGGFLPSEAEWEFAAAGGSEQREYPWGAADPGGECQYAVFNYCYSGGIAPVGAAIAGAGRWGQLDLVGNVWEWNLDGYAAYANPCTDCSQVATLTNYGRILRGGFYFAEAARILPTYRWQDAPAGRGFGMGGYGFRCARIP